MGSSKVWRTGRWFWYCATQNRTMSWEDHWACDAKSKLTYSTKEEALKAGRNHKKCRGTLIEKPEIKAQQIKRVKWAKR